MFCHACALVFAREYVLYLEHGFDQFLTHENRARGEYRELQQNNRRTAIVKRDPKK